MKKIGLIIAVEESAIKERYGAGLVLKDKFGTTVYQTNRAQIYAVVCGAGEIPAAMAVQFLIDKYDVELIVNYGSVGACTYAMNPGNVCVVESVIQYDYDISQVDGCPVGKYSRFPSEYIPLDQYWVDKVKFGRTKVKKVVCASGDKFVADVDEKTKLYQKYGAEICDMESAGIAIACYANHVSCLLIKCVADSINGGAQEYRDEVDQAGREALDLLDAVVL